MCGPGAPPGNDIISVNGTDTELIQRLVKLQERNPGLPLPSNVLDDVNPLEFEPSNLPGAGIWYLVPLSKGSKQTNIGGVWKEKGEASRIYSCSAFSGWKKTHEFHLGPPTADNHKTGWVMQEYWISSEDPIKQKGSSRSLCRVFLCDDGEDGNIGSPNKDDNEPLTENRESKPGQAPIASTVQASDYDCITEGDFLEIADLVNSRSSSSASSDSSSFSRVADEFFDSEALLQDLACADEAYSQLRAVSHHLNVSRPSDGVVVSVASAVSIGQQGTLPLQDIRVEKSVATLAPDTGLLPDKDCNKRKAEVPASSSSGDAGASSSRQRPGSERGKKVHVGKSMKKFFCFLAF